MADLTGVAMDANVEEDNGKGGFEALPPGFYNVVIVKDEVKNNKKNTGKLLVLTLQVTEGPYVQKTITDNINLTNASAQAAQIGQGQLKRLCRLTGTPYPPQDTATMYGKPLQVTVKVEEFTSNKSGKLLKSNKVTAYNEVGTDPIGPTVTPATPATGAATAGGWG